MIDVKSALQNNPIFRQALELAKTDEERKQIEEASIHFVDEMLGIFASAFSAPPPEVTNEEIILVSEQAGRPTTDDGTG